MHMADALISPIVGGTMWVATAGVAAYSIKKVQSELDEKKIPLMGVMGAFIFAAQMINFSIPGTGSSGHLGGGLILAILLGPYAGFLTMASILSIQALFFADGGLLALGSNIFNLGFFTCFIAYPLIYKKIMSRKNSPKRIIGASLVTAVLGLQMGAFGVVLETLFSGKTELPFGTFVLMMQPIHLAIGIVEGLVTATVVSFIWKARPEILEGSAEGKVFGNISMKKVLSVLVIVTVITGGALSWFASSNPDGLEWSMFKTAGVEELEAPDGIHKSLADLQSKTAFLPDYGFKVAESEGESQIKSKAEGLSSEAEGMSSKAEGLSKEITAEAYPSVSGGTSIAGFVGGALTLVLAVLIGLTIRAFKKKKIVA